MRTFLDSFIQDTAQEAHDTAEARIANGEDRDAVLGEYVSDAAFETWYTEFMSGLQAAAGI